MSTLSNLLNPELLERSNGKTVLTTHVCTRRLWSLNELIPADTPSGLDYGKDSASTCLGFDLKRLGFPSRSRLLGHRATQLLNACSFGRSWV